MLLQSSDSQRSRQSARADVIKSMLPIVDSFEMARGQLQPANQGEQKIDSAYQVGSSASSRP